MSTSRHLGHSDIVPRFHCVIIFHMLPPVITVHNHPFYPAYFQILMLVCPKQIRQASVGQCFHTPYLVNFFNLNLCEYDEKRRTSAGHGLVIVDVSVVSQYTLALNRTFIGSLTVRWARPTGLTAGPPLVPPHSTCCKTRKYFINTQ